MGGWCALLVLVGTAAAFGCQDGRIASDGGADGPSSQCGDGILDQAEECDDGAATGTPSSRCSRQCRLEDYVVSEWPSIPLDEVPTRISRVNFFGTQGPSGVAYVDGSGSNVHVMPDTGSPYWESSTMPPIVTFPTTSPPVALGSLQQLPIWVEPGTQANTFRLFYGELGANNVPVAHEIPYPFAGGTRPSLIQSAPSVSALLVDEDPQPPHDLIVAVIVLRDDLTVQTTTFRTNSPTGSISNVGTTTENLDDNATAWEQQLVVFFDDPGSFVALRVAQPYPDLRLGNPASAYRVSEIARGGWPYHVISATTFNELCTSSQAPQPSALRNPMPLAVLTSDGDIIVWQFTHGIGTGETFAPLYASPGKLARTLGFVQMHDVFGVWALGTDGAMKMYGDSDCADLQSPALAPFSFQFEAGQPLVVDDRGVPSLGYASQFEFVQGKSYFSDVFGEHVF